jgi:hypothetical protein
METRYQSWTKMGENVPDFLILVRCFKKEVKHTTGSNKQSGCR